MRTDETYEQLYAGNASTVTTYPITAFQFDDPDDLEITTKNGSTETVLTPLQYTITRDPSTAKGSFVTNPAIPATSTVKIARRNVLIQDTDYVHSDGFPAESHERMLDRIIESLQYIRSIATRALRVSSPNQMINSAPLVPNSLAGLDTLGQTIFRTSEEVKSFLSLAAPILNFPTKSWLNDAERALAVPDFLGQVGTQRNTSATYVSTAITAGAWVPTLAGGVPDLSITRSKLADGALSADVMGLAKMADAFVTLAKMNIDFITAMTAKTLLEDGDYLAGWSAVDNAYRKFAGSTIHLPGSIVQSKLGAGGFVNAGAVIPFDGSTPQITEGVQMFTLAISPKFSDSLIRCTALGNIQINPAKWGTASLFRNPVSNAIKYITQNISVSNSNAHYVMVTEDNPATTSAVTYSVRAGAQSASTGMTATGSLILEEIRQ